MTSISRARSRLSRTPARTLHAVDIKTLTRMACPCVASVVGAKRTYRNLVGLRDYDQVVIACSRFAYVDVGVGWGESARYRVSARSRGTELELLDTLENENVVARFANIVIASGNAIFADTVTLLAAAGTPVVVVSSRAALSSRLALAAHRVVYLDPKAAVVASSTVSHELAA